MHKIKKPAAERGRYQELGKRYDLLPYYILVEQTPHRLLLHSRPGANNIAGRLLSGCGGILALLTLLLFCNGSLAAAQGTKDAFWGLVPVVPCSLVAGLGLFSGLAILTTQNTIAVDAEAQTVVYTQGNRVAPPHAQTLQFREITGLQLRKQTYLSAGFIRRVQQIIVLELVTAERANWLVESAATYAMLEPTATAFATLLGLKIDNSTESVAGDEQSAIL